MTRAVKLRRRRKNDTKFRISTNICRKLRREVETRLLGENHPDLSTANFLVWSAKKFQINRKEFHLDHIIPISTFNVKCPAQRNLANSPMNVRWLRGVDNLKKNNKMPTQEEIDIHTKLVQDWTNEMNYTIGLELNKFKTS